MPLETFPDVLDHLTQHKDLTATDMRECFSQLLNGKLSDIVMAAFLTALKVKGESAEELITATALMKQHATPFPLKIASDDLLMDCCGTGGDGYNTYNVSTLCSIVLAELGVPIAKHGNGKVSSHCGSADLLSQLGLHLNERPEQSIQCLKQSRFCFLLAPHYHPTARIVQPVRRALKTKTLFNLLGPLLNPAPLTHQLVGVYCPNKIHPMIQALKGQGLRAAMVVHGNGLDELTVHGENQVAFLKDNHIETFSFTPEEMGLKRVPIEQLISPNPQTSYRESLALLQGQGMPALKAIVALNCAASLFVTDKAPSIKSGVEAVMTLLSTSRSFERLMLIKKAQSC